MATIRTILWKHDPKPDGRLPLAIRITKDRKTSYIFTGEYIHKKDWDERHSTVKKSHANSGRLNRMLAQKHNEAHKKLMELESDKDIGSAKQLKQKIKNGNKVASFFAMAEQRIQLKYDEGVFSVSRAEQGVLNNIRKFHGDKGDLMFQEIDAAFIAKFKVFCKAQLSHSKRTITNHLIFIRTVFNMAIKRGLVNERYYPFGGEKEKIRLTSGHKIGLTEDELEAIEDLELEPNTTIWHTRNIWLIAFYFAGVRISDVLKLRWMDFKDDRLYYVMNKNDKPLTLMIPEPAADILAKYKLKNQHPVDYIFPLLKDADPNNPEEFYVKTCNASRLMNKYLKRIASMCHIDKNLSNHIARHSFGNIAGSSIHPLDLQKLYRHTDLKTTINYQANFIHKDADEALQSVLNFGKRKKAG